MIVIKGDAATRLQQLLNDYRNADDMLFNACKGHPNEDGMVEANKQFREAEMRIACIIDIFAEVLPDQPTIEKQE